MSPIQQKFHYEIVSSTKLDLFVSPEVQSYDRKKQALQIYKNIVSRYAHVWLLLHRSIKPMPT